MRLREFSTDKMIRISPDIKSEYINKTKKNHLGPQKKAGIDG